MLGTTTATKDEVLEKQDFDKTVSRSSGRGLSRGMQ
jgi:hypothetical protein